MGRVKTSVSNGQLLKSTKISKTKEPGGVETGFGWCCIYSRQSSLGFSSVQSLSRVQLFATPWTAARQASRSIINSWSLLKLTSIESVILCCCPIFPLPSIFPSIRVFSNESILCIRWQKYWSFSFSISPSNEYSALIIVRMDWLDLLAPQGTLKSFLQHHSSKALILLHSYIHT